MLNGKTRSSALRLLLIAVAVLAALGLGLADAMSRVLVDKTILPRQILLYRQFIRTVFLGPIAGLPPEAPGASGSQA